MRDQLDFYATPQVAVDELLAEIGPLLGEGYVLDPAAGDGALLTAVKDALPDRAVVGIEIDPARCAMAAARFGPDWVWEADYLKEEYPGYPEFALVIANPPYSLAQEFVDKMLRERGQDTIVAALLRINFLGSQKRAQWWLSHRPDAVRVLSKRPSFTGDGKTDSTEYAWYLWGEQVRPLAALDWYTGGVKRVSAEFATAA